MMRLTICCLSLLLACDLDPGVDAVDAAPAAVTAPQLTAPPSGGCVVATPPGVAAIVASAGGLVFAVATGDPAGPPLLVHRAHGDGCDLVAAGPAPVAAGELLDADDLGNLYVYPAGAGSTGAVSTMLPDEGSKSMIATVDREDRVRKLVSAGRGIWSFGVAPAGDALWMTACGPTGIFHPGDMTPALASPETLWELLPSVLSDAGTFWSVGLGTCDDAEPLTPACGHALVRTTSAGSEELASTIVDLGAGFERATLARCGANVCGLVSAGVLVWDRDGEVVRTIGLADALARPDERIVQVSGNDLGVYLLLQASEAARVVFVPLAG